MITFSKKQNTRVDFGNLFDFFIHNFWTKKYFISQDVVVNHTEMVNQFAQINNQSEKVVSCAELFENPNFINSNFCDPILENLVNGSYFTPLETLFWKNNENTNHSNSLFNEVYFTEDLPHYYIIHNYSYNVHPLKEFSLIDKVSGEILPLGILELGPSKEKNVFYGQFIDLRINENEWWKVEIGMEGRVKYTNLREIISIPEEFSEFCHIGFYSSIFPEGTNVNFALEELSMNDDIAIRNKIITILKKKKEETKLILPF